MISKTVQNFWTVILFVKKKQLGFITLKKRNFIASKIFLFLRQIQHNAENFS